MLIVFNIWDQIPALCYVLSSSYIYPDTLYRCIMDSGVIRIRQDHSVSIPDTD